MGDTDDIVLEGEPCLLFLLGSLVDFIGGARGVSTIAKRFRVVQPGIAIGNDCVAIDVVSIR